MQKCEVGSLEGRKLNVRKPESLERYLDFEFPPSSFSKRKFKEIKELNQELIRMGLKIGFYRGRLYRRKDHDKMHGKKMIFICKQRQCPSRLIYLWVEGQPYLQVQLFDNAHIHPKAHDIQRLKKQLIQHFIMDLPIGESWQPYEKWATRFDIGLKQSRYIVEQLYWYNNTEEQMFSRLAFEKKQIRRVKDQNDATLAVFICHENMKKNYQQFGEVVAFDFGYRMLLKRSVFGTKYGVGYFFGHDTNGRLVVFGNCIFAREDKEYFKYIFQFFFELIVRDQPPATFVSDDFAPVTDAFEEFQEEKKLKIHHIFNWFHVTNNIRQALEDDPNGEQIFYLFCKALSTPKHYIYSQTLEQIDKKLQNKQILSDFIQKQYQYAFCKMPPKFVGLTLLHKYGLQIFQRMYTCAVFDNYAGRFFTSLLHAEKMCDNSIKKTVSVVNDNIIKHILCEDIHSLQSLLELKVMDRIIRYFSDSLDMELEKLEPGLVNVHQKIQTDLGEKDEVFQVRYLLNAEYWECECKIQYMIGIPCAHLIKILKSSEIRGSLRYYINQRWIHDKQDIIPQHSKPFITRKIRRH